MLTGEEAIKTRDRMLTSFPDAECKTSYDEPRGGEVKESESFERRLVERALSQARLVTWEHPIWQSAVRDHEVFTGGQFDTVIREVPPQLWIVDSCSPCASLVFPLGVSPTAEYGPQTLAWVFITGPMLGKSQPAYMLHYPWAENDPCPDTYSVVSAALHFLDLPFVANERASLPRHLRRAAELKRRPPLPDVSTIVLRRAWREEKERHGNGEPMDYSCQWLVSGHWRNQWLPSKGTWEPRYVQPYLKGPEDKPFRAKQGTVYRVTR